jgi:hypothetical protein
MSYDLLVLAPAVAMIVTASADLPTAFSALARRWVAGICIAACALGAVFLGGHAVVWTPILLALAVLAVGLALAWRRWPGAPARA